MRVCQEMLIAVLGPRVTSGICSPACQGGYLRTHCLSLSTSPSLHLF